MTRRELRLAMRRATLDAALNLLNLAFDTYSESGPTNEEKEIVESVRQAYNNARRECDVTGE